ncbi:MAG: DUF362 domain-containing protein [Desulfovibrio sp.]|nr:DUF362 domain-containing protein [Desulfovibrio sp.]
MARHSTAMQNAQPVALEHCPSYQAPDLEAKIFNVLEHSGLRVRTGQRVLVKPNLLMPRPLACTTPAVTVAACTWLLEHGARVNVGDSPGFGRAEAVAQKIGLTEALRPLGLSVTGLNRPVAVRLPLQQGQKTSFMVARQAMESDLILSIPRVKAHSQMRLTLAVKNCFGCVSSLRKALIHAREGRDPDYFADCLAALWAALPPVAALADGITAMHITGPSRGQPFALGLLGASSHAAALDASLCAVLGLPPDGTPLGAALLRRKALGHIIYPLHRPEDFDASGFQLPQKLVHTSFHPARFLQSCLRRLWAACKS